MRGPNTHIFNSFPAPQLPEKFCVLLSQYLPGCTNGSHCRSVAKDSSTVLMELSPEHINLKSTVPGSIVWLVFGRPALSEISTQKVLIEPRTIIDCPQSN